MTLQLYIINILYQINIIINHDNEEPILIKMTVVNMPDEH